MPPAPTPQRPAFRAADAERLARAHFGIAASATELPGERDQNFRLDTPTGERFVLKLASAGDTDAALAAQAAAMARVAERTGKAPRVRASRSPEQLVVTGRADDGDTWRGRVVAWIDGATAASAGWHGDEYFQDLGRSVAAIAIALHDFDHAGAHRDFAWDLRTGLATCEARLPLVDAALRSDLVRILERVRSEVLPRDATLPRSVIHGDVNDHNVIVHEHADPRLHQQRVKALIDFGDLVHSWTVADLAIAAAYAALDARDPLATIAHVVRGYVQERALADDELHVLHDLVLLRLATSACMAADHGRHRPDDPYVTISQAPLRRTLPRLLAIQPAFATATYRAAAGKAPVPASARLVAFLAARAATFAPILGTPLTTANTTHVSLAVDSDLVTGDAREDAEPTLSARLAQRLASSRATFAVGGYGEARLVYASDSFDAPSAPPGERRTIHLGLDLFAPAGTPVHAPLDGIVEAVHDNAAPLDYGPVVVLRHGTADGTPFFSLYGHLARSSLPGLARGRVVRAGERFASLGTPAENGAWTPHLHVQLMTDLLGLGVDYPGVCRPGEREVWLALSPDPAPFAGVPAGVIPPPPPDATATLAARRQWLGKNLSVGYRQPVKVVRGRGQYLFDEQGRRLLDAYNNVPHVGHANPRIVAAATRQLAVLDTNTRYLHDTVLEFAQRLCATMPAPLRVAWFVNSGSEANELALRLARAHTRARDVLVLEAAYHGNTTTLIDVSPYKHAGPGGGGAPDWVHTLPLPDVYRGVFKAHDRDAGRNYAAAVDPVLSRLAARNRGVCAFLAESLPSVGGQIVLPPGYLEAVYAKVRGAGGVCIADEVQTAYGRIGTHFYGFEAQGVVPDIVVLGKPIGNGHPLGAVVTTPAIAASFANGMEFFSTFGGRTVSAAVGLEVLREVQERNLQAHARAVGEHLLAGLRPLVGRHPWVGDVRGSGLFLGLELVRDHQTLEPADREASFVVDRCREEGVLLGTDGPFHNVVKIRPPMVFDQRDADRLVDTVWRVLGARR